MSATPDRPDGLHKIFPLYFGPIENFIHRLEVKDFVVIKHKTSFIPITKYKYIRGKKTRDWNTHINSLAYDEKRNEEAAQFAISRKNERTMIVCGRTRQAESVVFHLEKKGEKSIGRIFDKYNEKGPSYRVIVAHYRKGGTGMNDPTLTLQILIHDLIDVRQVEGRIRTENNTIIDFVDRHPTSEKHWEIRKEWYTTRGAQIVDDNPEFEETNMDLPTRRFLPPNL